jgi:GntR family transcriptional regulator, transcriptional repressor for pyruvate dehydrogenase complex
VSILEQITPLEGASANRAEQIVRKLEVLIAESTLEAGTMIGKKEDLRRRFKVSPGTINEAFRILVSRGVVTMRRGSKGGIFLATTSLHVALRRSLLGLDRSAALVEECWAVFKQLEPLVVIEATKRVTDDAVTELNRLVSEISAAMVDEPIAPLRWRWHLYRKIAAMGSNTVLRIIYTTLMSVLEHKSEQVVPLANYSTPEQGVAIIRRVVEAIASGDIKRAASAVA